MQKQQSRDLPSVICAGSLCRTDFKPTVIKTASHAATHRLLPIRHCCACFRGAEACSIRQLADCMAAKVIVLTARFAASCRELQAGSLCSPDNTSATSNKTINQPRQCNRSRLAN